MTCPECDSEFAFKVAPGLPRRYCSPACRGRAGTRRWRAGNPESAAVSAARQEEKRRARRASDPEYFRALEAARYAADPERQKARVKVYRSDPAIAAKSRAQSAAWRKANPEANRAAVRDWEARNPQLVAHYQATRRARRIGNGGSHTLAEWKAKCSEYGHKCAYCGEAKKLTRDHAVPLSRGGTDSIDNIIPACQWCNSRKRTRTVEEFAAAIATA